MMSRIPKLPARLRIALRLFVIAVQILLVYWFGDVGMPFFYQGF